jgi:hypothetical protein
MARSLYCRRCPRGRRTGSDRSRAGRIAFACTSCSFGCMRSTRHVGSMMSRVTTARQLWQIQSGSPVRFHLRSDRTTVARGTSRCHATTITPSPHFMLRHLGITRKSAVGFERDGRGGLAATSQSLHDMLNKFGKVPPSARRLGTLSIAVKAVLITPAQRAQKRNFAHAAQ